MDLGQKVSQLMKINMINHCLLIFHNFGHMGDANMHLNIFCVFRTSGKHNVSDIDAMQKIVDDVVYSNVGKFNGVLARNTVSIVKSNICLQ